MRAAPALCAPSESVLVVEDSERIRGPALSIHVVNWKDTHKRLSFRA